MIKYNYEVSVNENRAKLNKDIFLFRGNRNIHYYFSIKGARFAFEKEGDLIENANAIYAAVTVIKPNGVEVANAIAPVENGLIHLKVTEDLIDEEVEIGDFDLVFDLFDDSDGAVTIPKIKGQFHVQERPCTTSIGTLSGNVNVVNQAVVDLAIATQENEQLIVVDDDGKYVKTTWVKGDKISIERLNKIEEGIEKNSTQYKDIADKIKNIGQPTQEQINTAIDKAIEDGKITGGGINSTAKNLLQTILQNAVYTTNQNANITALMSALGSTESGGDTPTIKTYTITNKLTNCTNSNISTSVDENSNYVATITPTDGYTLTGASVNITMGGTDITSTAYNNGTINISSVTGNVVITISAMQKQIETPTEYTYNIADIASVVHENTSGSEAIYYDAGNSDAGGYGRNEGAYCYVVENLKSGDKLYWKEHAGNTSTSTNLKGFVLYSDGTLGQLGKNPSFTEYNTEMQDNYSWFKVNITLSDNYDKLYITFTPTINNTNYDAYIPYLVTTTQR